MGKYQPLLKIVQYGSLTKAAQELCYNQSSLSYIANQMEEELGIKMFRRNRQGTTLTDVGEKLILVMEQIEALEQDLQQIALAHRSGMLRIGAFTSVSIEWLPEILKQFYVQNPSKTVFLEQLDCYGELEYKLEKGSLDCVFFVGAHQPEYHFTPLYQDSYYLVVSRDSPLAKEKAVCEKDIPGERFLLPSEGLDKKGPAGALFQRLANESRLYSQARNDLVTLNLVERDLGVSVMPGLLLSQIASGRAIRAIPLAPAMEYKVGILSKPKEESTDLTQAFIRAAKSFLSHWQPNLSWMED